ncbi:MAG TPA: HAD-IA family hydrolase [Tepidisphaeraceae bacterium]|nr:HAD-IA family hydrolase [Tepidisphaeraceae bacterium]
MSSSVKLVCFDLGRVLVRICDSWAHASEVAKVPVRLSHPLDISVKSRVNESVFAHEVGRLDHEPMCRELAKHFNVDAAHVDAIWKAYVIDVYAGAAELIEEVRSAGYKTACLSNVNPIHWRDVSAGGKAAVPIEKLDYRFGSHLIGHRKPDPGAYEHVERVTGIPGSQIVFFDDILENVEAARRREWQAEIIARDHQPIRQVRSHLVRFGVLKD